MLSPLAKPDKNLDQSALEKKIAELSQFQYLCWIPTWVPMILNAVNHTPTKPGREIIVLIFHIGCFCFSLFTWLALRRQIGKYKKQLAALTEPPASAPRPPIAPPF